METDAQYNARQRKRAKREARDRKELARLKAKIAAHEDLTLDEGMTVLRLDPEVAKNLRIFLKKSPLGDSQ
jgi:hypothetical protein